MKAAHVYCSHHCATCDTCFTSLSAFDRHRTGSHEANTRRCLDPEAVKRLDAVAGVCRVSRGVHQPRTDRQVYILEGAQRGRVVREAPREGVDDRRAV